MKKFTIFCLVIIFTNNLFSQTIFTFGKEETSKAEFLRAYNKNKPSTIDKEKSMREYLLLFSNFKLKVKAAQALQLDTIPQIKYDVQNFRDQIVDNYMNDEKGLQTLTNEAVYRSTKDIHVLYFFIPIAVDAKPADTLKAALAAKEIYKSLKNGAINYNEIAIENTSKFYNTKYADAGFVTAFTLPYELENMLYKTKIGSISEPYKANKGWFIMKPIEERAAIGKWKVSQLLFAFPPSADEATKNMVKAKADSVATLITKGLPFAEAAKLYSNDKMTYLNAGEMQEFGAGAYNNSFEKNVIALKNDNEISKPFETAFGYHIVKRLSVKAIPTNKDDANYQLEIKQKINQDARINSAKEKFIKDIIAKTGFKRNTQITDAELYKIADSTLIGTGIENTKAENIFSKKPLVSFVNGTVIKGQDWITFLKNNRPNGETPKQTNKILFENFSKQITSNYYRSNLENFNADFKYQMQEFKEGNMLFEIMERNVWSKAGADSIGLKKYYDANKQNYKWAASADVIIFTGTEEGKVKAAYDDVKVGISTSAIVEKSNSQIQADSGRYEISQLPGITENSTIKAGNITNVIKSTIDASASFVKIIKLYEANMQRSFSEARGLVINDYQTVLEQQWLDTLKIKYPIKINEAVFKEMVK